MENDKNNNNTNNHKLHFLSFVSTVIFPKNVYTLFTTHALTAEKWKQFI